jgi:Matrixin
MDKLRRLDKKTRPQSWARVALAVALAITLPVSNAQASNTRDLAYTSFFEGKNDNLLHSGWSSCASKITWSADMGALKPAVSRVEIDRLKSAFAKWADATGLNFEYLGNQSMTYNPSSHHLSAPGMPTTQHIAVAVLSPTQSSLLRGNVVGFGMPSLVLDSSNEIVGGVLVMKEHTVRTSSKKDPRLLDSLYLHEIGHVIGLGHVPDESQVMFPTIKRKTALGAGDLAGAAAITRSCE